MGYSPVHFNGNLFCAVDTETTGLNPLKHEVIQICIMPLGPDLKVSEHYKWFEIKIKPEMPTAADPEAIKVSRGLMQECKTYGIERWAAVDLMLQWFHDLKLPERKKIVPLGANFMHDQRFLEEFMGGPESYAEIFRSDYRDVQKLALAVNDMHDWFSEPIPFPKTSLEYLTSCLKVDHINKHDATGDCLATAEVYRRLMAYKDVHNPVPIPVSNVPDPLIDAFLRSLDSGQNKQMVVKQFLARTGRNAAMIEES